MAKPPSMASDRLNIRLNDEHNPKRGEQFEAALGLADKTKVTRALVDALIRYAEAQGSIPHPPFTLTGAQRKEK